MALSLNVNSAAPNKPRQELQLVTIRHGDPLGLGLDRPPPPPDPDTHDIEVENKEFSRSLLPEEERKQLDEEIKQKGYKTIAEVRDLIAENVTKESLENGIDPEFMALLDARINYKIFIAGDNVYTREELYNHFPFHELNTQPEVVFMAQEIGIFPPRATAMGSELEYVARDVGDETVDFVMIEDLVGAAARANYRKKREPLRIIKTKIYVGKEAWHDFLLLQRFFRGAVRTSLMIAGTGAPGAAPGGVPGAAPGAGAAGPLMIEDPRHREEELRIREEELKAREAEIRAREAEANRRIEEDLKRIESMMEMLKAATQQSAAATQQSAAQAAAAQAAAATQQSAAATQAAAQAAAATQAAATQQSAAAPSAAVQPENDSVDL